MKSEYVAAFVALLFISRDIYIWITHYAIRKNGIVGTGILTKCKRIIKGMNLRIVPDYDTRVMFYIENQKKELRPLGIFYKPIADVGDEISIIYWERYSEKVIINDDDGYWKKYLLSMIFWTAFFLLVLFL